MFYKQIHKDDFRLRLLVTNSCNKSCNHCLNDFQEKGTDYLSPMIASRVIKDYCSFMEKRKLKSQIEISGGEPGLYAFLDRIISYASNWNTSIKVNTNGLALKIGSKNLVDCWHIGVNSCEESLLYDIKKVRGQAQFVVTYDSLKSLSDIVRFYKDVPLKLFVDFFEEGQRKQAIENAIKQVAYKYSNIKTRYTGVQENRGLLCVGCKRKCITLKALWVFPNGTMSLCPQRCQEVYNMILPSMDFLYLQHKT